MTNQPMKLTFIGAGNVGAALAVRLANAGHDVVLARSPESSESVDRAMERSSSLRSRPLHEAIEHGDVVFLAVPFSAHQNMLPPIAAQLAGKVVVDCTNPVGPGLTHGLGDGRSGSEVVQSLVPDARVVKAFTIYGFENLNEPSFSQGRAAMLFCGDDQGAKADVVTLIEDCTFEPVDVGGLTQALHLEHMTLLWVRLVRVNGHSPRLTWAALRA